MSIILMLGVVVSISGVASVFVHKSGSIRSVGVIICGIILIVFNDPKVSKLSCDFTNGCSWERTGPPDGEQIKGVVNAELAMQVDALGQSISSKFLEMNVAIEQIQSTLTQANSNDPRLSDPAPLPNSTIPNTASLLVDDNKGIVLVFFATAVKRMPKLLQILCELLDSRPPQPTQISKKSSNGQEVRKTVKSGSQSQDRITI